MDCVKSAVLAVAGEVTNEPEVSGAVVSVEQVSIPLTGTSHTVNLSKGQALEQCAVVSWSMSHTTEGAGNQNCHDDHMPRVRLVSNGGTAAVRIDRSSSGNFNAVVTVSVVEFNEDIRVQQVSFSATNAAQSSAGCDAVNLDHAFLCGFSLRSQYTGSANSPRYTANVFDFASPVSVRRRSQAGNVLWTMANVFVVEDLTEGDHFTVSSYGATILDKAQTKDVSIVAVSDVGRSSVFSSHHRQGTSSDQRHNSRGVFLLDEDTVRVRRRAPANNSDDDFVLFVVEWTDGTVVHRRNEHPFPGGDSGSVVTASVPLPMAVDPDLAVVNMIDTQYWSFCARSDGDATEYASGKIRATLDENGEAVTLHRIDSDSLSYSANFEVLDFAPAD